MGNAGSNRDKAQFMDYLMSCIYDVREELVTPALQHGTKEDRVSALGSHWEAVTFDFLANEGLVAYNTGAAKLSPAGEKLLLTVAGIPPKPDKNLMAVNMSLQAQIQSLLQVDPAALPPHRSLFRVLPVASPTGDDPVAVHHTCLGHPEAPEIAELAQVGLNILAHGDYGVAFTPKQGWNTTALYVYSRPGKAPRTDITLAEAIASLTV